MKRKKKSSRVPLLLPKNFAPVGRKSLPAPDLRPKM